MARGFPGRLRRGVKAVRHGQNGAGFLRRTPSAACIAEPFFGSSPEDFREVAEQPEKLADALAAGLADGHAKLRGRNRT